MRHFFKFSTPSYAHLLMIVSCTIFLTACGGGGSDSGATPNPSAPILTSVGNKTISIGAPTLTFIVAATDPNNLQLMLSTDGSVGNGLNPYTETGTTATFNTNTGQFRWDITSVAEGDYFVQFSVMNTNAETDSETIHIRVQGQLAFGGEKYNAQCQRCHGTGGVGGSQTLIQCIDSVTFFEKINGGSMAQYAGPWSTTDKNAVLYYLNNVNPGSC